MRMPIRTGNGSTTGDGNFDSTITLEEHAARTAPVASVDQKRSGRIPETNGMSRFYVLGTAFRSRFNVNVDAARPKGLVLDACNGY